DLLSRQSGGFFCVLCGFALQMSEAILIPTADSDEHDDAEECGDGKPGGTDLSVGKDDEDCKQRPDGRARVATDLKERLREAVLAARGHSGYAGGFRMEDCRAHADERSSEEQQGEGGGDRQQQQADEGEDHPDGKRVWHRLAVGVMSDDWLKERRGDLEGEGDEA